MPTFAFSPSHTCSLEARLLARTTAAEQAHDDIRVAIVTWIRIWSVRAAVAAAWYPWFTSTAEIREVIPILQIRDCSFHINEQPLGALVCREAGDALEHFFDLRPRSRINESRM